MNPPERGDLVWLDFTPQAGHEQAGWRPALVLSPKVYNDRSSLALFCPITSVVKGYPFEVALPVRCPIQGVVLADQVRSLDWRARGLRFEARLAPRVVSDVLRKLATLVS